MFGEIRRYRGGGEVHMDSMFDGLEDVPVHDGTDLLERESVPESLVVIGGGYVGCEYARMYADRCGCHCLPAEDPDVSEVIELGATADDIANTMHVHPALPESINSAAGGVHKPS